MIRPWRRAAAVALTAAVVAAACGGDGDADRDAASPTAEAPPAPASDGQAATAPGGDVPELVIGVVLPETGSLGHLHPPMGAGLALAIEDIEAAGGNIRVLTGDTATDPDVAPEVVNRLLGEGAHVILGGAASGISQSFIQTLSDAQVPQCAPSNTSTSFSTQANADFYFRTAPSVVAEAPLLANLMATSGATQVAVINRSDDWGVSLADQVEKRLGDLGVATDRLAYAQDAPNYGDVVSGAVATGADTFLIISFIEGVQITRGLLEAGVPPTAIFAGAGLFNPTLPERVDSSAPERLDGFVVISPFGTEAFNQRIMAQHGGPEVIYGANTYDCLVVLALASLAAGSVDGPAIMAAVQGVTRGGTKCFNYGECADLLAAGADIDYDGVSGPIDLDSVGDITVGTYAVMEVTDGETAVIDIRQVEIDS